MKTRRLLSAGIAAVIAATTSVSVFADFSAPYNPYQITFSEYNDYGRQHYKQYFSHVWVNGKNVNDDKSTTNIDETHYYKTAEFQTTGMFTGGTWRVAVTPYHGGHDVEDFLKCLDDKCNVYRDIQTETKKYATAKIKDGVVTVTAGKEAGEVCVWVYEVKKNPATNKLEVVINEELDIGPTCCEVDVYVASANPVIAYPDDFEEDERYSTYLNTPLKSNKKPLSKLTMAYKVGAEEQESVVLAVGDKKTVFDNGMYLIDGSSSVNIKENYLLDKDGKEIVDSDGYHYYSNEFTVTPTKAGNVTLIGRCTPSGKTASLKVTIIDYYKVTKPENVVVRYKTKEGYVTVNNGDYVPNKTKLEIFTPLKFNGTDTQKDLIHNYTVNKEHIVITYKVGANGEELTVTPTP